MANQVSARINDKLAESAALSTLDSQLSAQLQQEQAALAARVKASSSSGGGSGGSGGGGGGGTVSPVITRPGLSTVGGITVASSIAGQLASLLNAASAGGLHARRQRLPRLQRADRPPARRTAAPATTPSTRCPRSSARPPTAIPGRSKHEQGLAVDFTIDGHTLRTSDGAYRWMVANAASYGFVNLPGEPWHWSVGGG